MNPILAALLLLATCFHAGAQVRGEFLLTNHGGKGDGVFDNAPLINSLIDQLPNTGGSIVIPHGDFRINSPVTLRKSFVTIRGLGRSSKLVVGAGVTDGILVPDESTRISGVVVRDLHIAGTDWGLYQTGLKIDRASDGIHVDQVSFTGLSRGIFIRASDALQITGCNVTQSQSSLYLSGGIMGVVTRNRFSGYSGGITVELADLDRIHFSSNLISPDGYIALQLRNAHNCNISGNSISSWYTGAIEIDGNMNCLSGNHLSAVQSNGEWLPDPRGRDGLWGLVRIKGNDNSFTSGSILSWQPENDIRVNILSGERTTLRDLTIAAIGSNKKISVDPAASWPRITHCGWPQETSLNGNPTARVVYDP
jgi:hypothetical protein